MACCTVATAANRAARRSSSATSSVVNELHRHRTRYYAGSDAFVEEEPDCRPAAITVIERPVIHVHPDERIGLTPVESTRKAHCMVQCVLAMIEAIRDALTKMPRDFPLHVARHRFTNDVATERERQPGFLEPPSAHVGDEMQSFVLVCELALVNQQPRINLAADHGLLDLIEGNDDGNKIRLKKLERQVGARHHSGHGHSLTRYVVVRHRLLRNEHGPVAIAHRSAVREDRQSTRLNSSHTD